MRDGKKTFKKKKNLFLEKLMMGPNKKIGHISGKLNEEDEIKIFNLF